MRSTSWINGSGSQQEKRLFYYTVPLISISFLSLCFYFFMNFRGLLKYQTNLDTHPPGCINLNGTHFQNTHLPEHLSDHFHESFPGGFSKPDELTQNTFVKICMEEPRFQANFPQVRLVLCLYWSLQSPCSHKKLINITFKHVFKGNKAIIPAEENVSGCFSSKFVRIVI